MRKILVRAIQAAILFGIAGTAETARAEGGIPLPFTYVGVAVGGGNANPALSDMAFNEYAATAFTPPNDCGSIGCISEPGGGLGFKLYGGKRVSPNFGFEGYIASIASDEDFTTYTYVVSATTSAQFTSAGATANGYYEVVEGMHLYGKGGLQYWSATGDTYISDGITPFTGTRSFSQSGVGLVVGGGVQYVSSVLFTIDYDYYIGSAQDVDFGFGFFSMGIAMPL